MSEYTRPPMIDPEAEVFEGRPGKPIFLSAGIVIKEACLVGRDCYGAIPHDYLPEETWPARQALSDKGIRLARYQYVVGDSQRVPGMTSLYTAAEYIDGEPLLSALDSGNEVALQAADQLTNRLIDLLDDCLDNGGVLDIELVGYQQFMFENATDELVLVDLDPSLPHIVKKRSGLLERIEAEVVIEFLAECSRQVETLRTAGLSNPTSQQKLEAVAEKIVNQKVTPENISRCLKYLFLDDDEPMPANLNTLLRLS